MAVTKAKLSQWFTDIRVGDLYCPFEGCTWTFFTSFELADHIKEDCEFGNYKGNVPCTHCSELLKADELKFHWRHTHKDMVSMLASLHRGIAAECPNYLCDESFCGSFKECKRYLKHSITCRPLFLCKVCQGEYRSKNILQQHQPKCSGAIKREMRKSVSKKEVEVNRNIAERPRLSDSQEEAAIADWREALESGKYLCPVPSCSKQFFVTNHFVKHLQQESSFDKIFEKISTIECPFCTSLVDWPFFHRHMQDYHREIANVLNLLKSGSEVSCPNYKCTAKQVFTCETGTDYLQHSLICRPLYCCDKCGAESKHEKYINKHKEKCKGTSTKSKSNAKTNAPTNMKKETPANVKKIIADYKASKTKATALTKTY